jgi:hypothetical protein
MGMQLQAKRKQLNGVETFHDVIECRPAREDAQRWCVPPWLVLLCAFGFVTSCKLIPADISVEQLNCTDRQQQSQYDNVSRTSARHAEQCIAPEQSRTVVMLLALLK